jgi:hypothetical protein
MALSFPNQSRSFDATRRGVRFWGYDTAMEAAFFVGEEALKRVQPDAVRRGFDSPRVRFEPGPNLRDRSQSLCTRPPRLVRSGRLGLLSVLRIALGIYVRSHSGSAGDL